MASLTYDVIRNVRPVLWVNKISNYFVSAWPGRYPVTFVPQSGTFWSHPKLLYKQHIVEQGGDLQSNQVPFQWRRAKQITYQTSWTRDQMWDVVKDVGSHAKHLGWCNHLIVYDKQTNGDTTTLRADFDIHNHPMDAIITQKEHYMLIEAVDKYDNEFVWEFNIWYGDDDWREVEYLKQVGVLAKTSGVDAALHEIHTNQVARWLEDEIRHMMERQKHWEYIREPMEVIPDREKDPDAFMAYVKRYLLKEKKRLTKAQKAFLTPAGDPSLVTMPTRVTMTYGIFSQPSVDMPQFEPRVLDEMLQCLWQYWRAVFFECRERYGDPTNIPVYPENVTDILGRTINHLPVPFDPKLSTADWLQFKRNSFLAEGPGLEIRADKGDEWLTTPPPTAAEIQHKY